MRKISRLKKLTFKKIAIGFAKLFVVGIIVFFLLFTNVDRAPFDQSPFYNQTIHQIDSIGNMLGLQAYDTIAMGWSEKSIVPDNPVRLTGNRWQPYESVHDSVYVKCFIFANQHKKIVLLNYDLWIMHPHLANKIKERLFFLDQAIDGVYLTASHTHSSIGGWAKGLLGSLVIGGNNEATLNFILDQTEKALLEAKGNLLNGKIGYAQYDTDNMVKNRLNNIDGKVDEQIRVLKLQNLRGEQAFLSTFSAHTVLVDKHLNEVSSDYPGPFTEIITNVDSVTMASFAAGAMGSHSPVRSGPFDYQMLDAYAKKLAKPILSGEDSITLSVEQQLYFAEFPVNLRTPHFRISKNIRVRPWLFKLVLGASPSYISMLRLGKTVLIGLPVELSGEYYQELEAYYRVRGLSLIITSFNGNYLGYVNPIRYYDSIRKAETRDMNWYGPGNGEYFVALIKEIGSKLK